MVVEDQVGLIPFKARWARVSWEQCWPVLRYLDACSSPGWCR